MENSTENNVDNNIKVFGSLPANAETELNNVEEAEQTIIDETIDESKQTQETDVEKKEVINNEESKKEIGKEVESTKKDSKEVSEESLKISFNNEKTVPETSEHQKATNEKITKEQVLSFLEENGIKVDDISNLTKKESLSEDVQGFKKFKDETGGSLKDYFNSQRDWSKETKADTIREYYQSKYPNLSEEDFETQLDLLQVTEEDEENLTERELKSKNLEYNKTYAEALDFVQKRAKEYSIPEQSKQKQVQPTAEQIAEAHRPYWDSRDKSLKNLKEININLDGIGDINVPISEEFKQLLIKNTETQDAYFDRWKKPQGSYKYGETAINTDLALEDTLWGILEIRESILSSMLEQAHTLFIDKFSKENRNVNLGKKGEQTHTEKQGNGVTVFGSTEVSKAGTPLI